MSVRIVTFLGLGKADAPSPEQRYKACRYRLDEIVTLATFNHDVAAGMHYPGEKTFVVLGTSDVKKVWFEDSRAYETELRAHGIENPIVFREIPKGEDANERWRIFEEIVECLSPEAMTFSGEGGALVAEASAPEEIVLDITHGFRSQPFFAASAVSFAKSQARRRKQNLNVRILYAAFEAKPKDSDIAEVWDLTQLIEVLDWTAAIDAFMRFGRADDVEALAKITQKRLMQSPAPPKTPSRIGKFGGTCKAVADGLATARAPQLMTELLACMEAILPEAKRDLESWVPPAAQIVEDLRAWTRGRTAKAAVSRDALLAGARLAGLYLQLERFAEAAAVLKETITSAWQVMTFPDAPPQPGPKGDPLVVKRREASDRQMWRRNEERKAASEHGTPKPFHPGEDALLSVYNDLGQLRNDIEHAGFNDSPRRASAIREQLAGQTERLEAAVNEMLSEPGHWPQDEKEPGCFLNISNHPVNSWPEEQLRTATEYGLGPPVDLPDLFPPVEPAATTADIQRVAETTVKKALALNPAICHVAGEFTLTFAIVSRLQNEKVRCVAAATTRVANETPQLDGAIHKEAVFRFHGWRDYPLLTRGGE